MKTRIALAAPFLALGLFAAPEKAIEIVFGDQSALVSAAMKLGEFAGRPGTGAMAVMALAQNPVAQELGPMRPGANAKVIVYSDGTPMEPGKASLDEIFDKCFYVALYPCNTAKEAYLASHPSAREEAGAVLSGAYALQFAADGRWIAVSEPKNANFALGVLAAAEAAPVDSANVLKGDLTPAGLRLAEAVVACPEFNGGESDAKAAAFFHDLLSSFASSSIALRVGDRGVDIAAESAMAAGGKYSDMGKFAFQQADPLAFAGNAIAACANARGMFAHKIAPQLASLREAFGKYGFKLDFLSLAADGRDETLVLDLPALVEYVAGEGSEAAGKLSLGQISNMVDDLANSVGTVPELAAEDSGTAFAIKGVEAKRSAGSRFAAAMPGFEAGKCCQAGVASIYAMVKGVVARLADMPFASSESATIKSLLSTLPADDDACIAFATRREGDRLEGIVRATPAEVKGLVSCVTTAIAGMGAVKHPSFGQAYDNEDFIDDDDDED